MNQRRPFALSGVVVPILACLLVTGAVMADPQVMPPSRLAGMSDVTWTAVGSPQRAEVRVQPTVTANKATLKVTVPGYEIAPIRQQGIDFRRIDVPGAPTTSTIGRPELPVVRHFVTIPDARPVSTTTKTGPARTVPDITVYPVQQPVPERDQQTPFAFDKAFYGRDEMYPATLVTVSSPMKMRNVTMVQVEIALMQYNGARHTLTVYENVEVEISFCKR